MAERFCIRGCTQRGVHYASCAWYGIDEALVPAVAALPNVSAPCTGCAETPARDHALICNRCYGRLRGLIDDAPDLIGRLRSLADPTKATPTDKAPGGGSSSEPLAPVDAELLDSLDDLVTTWGAWQAFCYPDTLEQALDGLVNDHHHVEDLGTGFMDRNELDADGIRGFWSFADARAKWGAERRTKGPSWSADDVNVIELESSPVAEQDQLLTRIQANEFAGSERTLRRWQEKELITPDRTVTIAGARVAMFRLSDLRRVRDEMAEKVGRPRKGALA